MIRTLLLSFLGTLFLSLAFSQEITHVDFGPEGIAYKLNESTTLDLNLDGIGDMKVNTKFNELCLEPKFYWTCFASQSQYSVTSWGARQIQIFEEGDVVDINDSNLFDYIDDDRAGLYIDVAGAALGWEDGQSNYIGFALLVNNGTMVSDGWMRMEIDVKEKELIIYEYAYLEITGYYDYNSKIVVGDKGLVNVDKLHETVTDITVGPNPTRDIFQVTYNNTADEPIQISVYDKLGQEVISKSSGNNNRVEFDASTWTAGIYYINLSNSSGQVTKTVMISH